MTPEQTTQTVILMCGIIGLFLKDKSMEVNLGRMLSEMLVTMTDRGPDSAGIAVYNAYQAGQVKLPFKQMTRWQTLMDWI